MHSAPRDMTGVPLQRRLCVLGGPRTTESVPWADYCAFDQLDAFTLNRKKFFRTKLCPFIVFGRCMRGESCTYAHSSEQLRPLPDLRKTKLCPDLKKGRVCTRDDCEFAHARKELKFCNDNATFKTSLCFFWKKGKCLNGVKCRFAHGEHELRQPILQQDVGSSSRALLHSVKQGCSMLQAVTASVLPIHHEGRSFELHDSEDPSRVLRDVPLQDMVEALQAVQGGISSSKVLSSRMSTNTSETAFSTILSAGCCCEECCCGDVSNATNTRSPLFTPLLRTNEECQAEQTAQRDASPDATRFPAKIFGEIFDESKYLGGDHASFGGPCDGERNCRGDAESSLLSLLVDCLIEARS